MPQGFTVNVHRFDPYKNFRFQVMLDGRMVMGVSKMGALKRTTEVVNYRSGGGNTYDFKSPGRTKYEAVTLERGITHDPEFERWAARVHPHDGSSNAELREYKRDLIVNLLNLQGQVAISYRLFRCWPSSYTALPDLDAGQNAVAVESLTLEVERWERDESVTEPTEG
ncbi:phage tail protein [Rhodovulum euryhalinum]|uniref:Phage tail-like protein n=1 Tax=Rhodovulum euryhalinum TaxID=35805 RepID=A0A4V6NP86_9RHOB|nr:phage tail protein [Rhodovulum euryhalinum]TCO70120.1 phage tail-like protein [Rhodovulum euryhalinum]